MANPRDARPGQPHLIRDNQQWVFDYVLQDSGRTYHWWTGEGRTLPESVRSHAMVSKHLGRLGLAKEADAQSKNDAGDERAALELYWSATRDLIKAQHHIFELSAEKHFLYDSMERCYEKVRELCPYTIERIEIPFEGEVVAGYLHVCPDVDRAPLLFYMPGCDTTCESSPDPTNNLVHQRGMHVFSFDGPGLGQSNMRGIKLTGDNFERAASAALDVLVERSEVDEEKVVTYGGGAGSYWAMRLIATDHRLKAAATKSSYSDKYFIMNEDSPRYKRLFGFLTGSTTESELDEVMAEMNLDDHMGLIECPTLMLTGEYDHRDPIAEVYRLFDKITAPKELWVFADQFHQLRFAGGVDVYSAMLDWLVDRLEGKEMTRSGEVIYLEPDADGPDSTHADRKRHWYES
jgi:dipeptidyl aminopeptidase/acylaminoacyl peptidase